MDRITIQNCKNVTFKSNAVKNIRNLRAVELKDIENLIFEESSLDWNNYVSENDYSSQWELIPSLRISIERSHIVKISSYTFKGRINEISLSEVVVDQVSAFAFASLLQNQLIRFENVKIVDLQPQALKKFSTNDLQLIGVTAGFLPSRAFSDIQVNQNFIINNCNLDTLRPSAFLVTNPRNFEVRGSRFNQLDGEAFRIMMRGPVLFKNNEFNTTNDGAFRAINLAREEIHNEHLITFDTNTFNTVTRDSLVTSDLTPKFINVLLNQPCVCKSMNNILKDSEFGSEIQCTIEDGEPITIRDFERDNCSIITSHATVIIVVCSVLIVFILVAAALTFYFKKVRNSDKYGKDTENKNGKLSLIVPDGRTYRETEVHVIVERANLLTTDL